MPKQSCAEGGGQTHRASLSRSCCSEGGAGPPLIRRSIPGFSSLQVNAWADLHKKFRDGLGSIK